MLRRHIHTSLYSCGYPLLSLKPAEMARTMLTKSIFLNKIEMTERDEDCEETR